MHFFSYYYMPVIIPPRTNVDKRAIFFRPLFYRVKKIIKVWNDTKVSKNNTFFFLNLLWGGL